MVHKNRGNWFPDDIQELLLEAILRDEKESHDSYGKWKERINLDNLCDSSFFLLPMLYINIGSDSTSDRIIAKAKGVHHQYCYKNALVLNRYTKTLDEMSYRGIKCCISGDILMLNWIYKDIGARALMVCEVFVEEDDFQKAADIIISCGWKSQEPGYKKCFEAVRNICFYDENKKMLYLSIKNEKLLYWNGMHWCTECLVPFEASDFRTADLPLALEYEKLLASTILGGIMGRSEADLTWIMDSAYILKAAGERFDWKIFIDEIRQMGFALHIQNGIRYLNDRSYIKIPEWAHNEILSEPVSKIERELYNSGISRGMHEKLKFLWLSYNYAFKKISAVRFIKILICRYKAHSIVNLALETVKRRRK